MKIAELLHFCLTAKRSGVIRLKGYQDAAIYIRDGEVVAARHDAHEGEPAFFGLLALQDIETEFVEQDVTEPESISKSTHYLLMEAARLSDVARQSDRDTGAAEGGSDASSDSFCLHFKTLDDAKFALVGHTVLIGRDNMCDITVPDVSVSSSHCQIFWTGHDHILSDLGSSNGTYVNDSPLREARPLAPGDKIQIGLCHFVYERVTSEDALVDPKAVVPFTFGSQTQKIELPTKNTSTTDPPQTEFREFKPVAEDKKKIHIWPFGKDS